MLTDTLPRNMMPPGVAILAGPFGSGKTEIAINLALRWAPLCPTFLADLDIVTPYFRSREHAAPLAEAGVTLVAPIGPAAEYDAPVLPLELSGAVDDSANGLVIDIGGERHGVGALINWQEALKARDAKVHFVLNPRRPNADRPEEMVALAEMIVSTAGLPLASVIANGNIGAGTMSEDILDGFGHARALGELLGVPVSCVCCPENLVGATREAVGDVPVFGLAFYLRPPWERG